MADLGSLKALAFDVGGTVLDRHRGIVEALIALGQKKRLEADGRKVTNAWRMRTLKEMLAEDFSGQRSDPLAELNIDAMHRALIDPVADTLDDLAAQLGA
ncbi:MAG: hypothetical protein O7A68_13080 [Alphaproteobacteria bacterium]|nr:hypothetical protein [Alphaproteobacteria bacterium]